MTATDSGAPILVVDDLSVRRGGVRVLAGVSLDVAPGSTVAVVGPNGCGKSTLLGAVAGLFPPHRGCVTIGGHDVWGGHAARRAARTRLGFVPEGADPPGFLRGRELWALASTARGAGPAAIAPEVDAALGLEELADLRLEQMSLGQRRRACLGAALAGWPPLLVLDEPDNGLDARRLDGLVDLLAAQRRRGGAALLSTHDPGLVERLEAIAVALPER